MLIDRDIKEVKRVDNIDEANSLITLGWLLLETGTKVVEDETVFFFLLGKTALMELKERIAKYQEDEDEEIVPFKS